ncbi:hypothetical protein [Dysosmobacter sp.]|uniref:hypothetical protein n=1 Tax=Dysosmobacter sp. TaxID=2591382 RepID=UPI002A8E0A37|nr:hypothetical protein [Dysosmobacter sp.]MDY3985806.1 hypothetical protein [Dysosmobacter sp.]
MTDQELRKLRRPELLEMLLEQSRETDRLREQLQQMKEQLESRQIMLNEAGSIAEASLQMNRVFEAAQQAADQYLENIRVLSGRQESVCAQMEEDSRRRADQLLAETQEKCRIMEAETQEKCSRMVREAEEASARVWEEMRGKLEQFVEQRAGLRELLEVVSREPKDP